MGNHILIRDENQTDAVGDLLAFDQPKSPWRIQRSDGRYYSGVSGGGTGVACFAVRAEDACSFMTETGAQHFLDISQGSAKSRLEFKGCKPVCLEPPLFEPGDHVICSTCGVLHERDYCPVADGQGVAL